MYSKNPTKLWCKKGKGGGGGGEKKSNPVESRKNEKIRN